MLIAPLVLVAALAAPAQDGPPPCTADIRWAHDTEMIVSRTAAPRPLTLHAAVGGGRYCLPARIHLSFVYFDNAGDVVCSGTLGDTIPQQSPVQYTHLEIRPAHVFELVRWRNGPRPTAVRWERLSCLAADTQSEVQPGELNRATSLRVHATIRPDGSGVATADLRLLLQP